MAYFRVAVSPDDGLAFERIVNVPKRGIGDKALQEINRTARDNGISLLDAAGLLVANGGLPARARAALGQLVDGFDRWHAAVRDGPRPRRARRDHPRGVAATPTCGAAEKSPDAAGRLDNLKELVKALGRVREPPGLPRARHPGDGERAGGGRRQGLGHDPARRQGPRVPRRLPARLGGRPLPVAALDGRERRSRASRRSAASPMSASPARERLCTISFAANRRVYNQWQSQLPSRFVDELPPAHVEVLTPPGLYGGGFGAAAPAAPARRSPTPRPGPTSTTPPAGSGCRPAPRAPGQSSRARRSNMVIDATAAARLRHRHPRLPPEVRLRHRHRGRGRQADHRLREGRRARTSSPASSPPPTPCRSDRRLGPTAPPACTRPSRRCPASGRLRSARSRSEACRPRPSLRRRQPAPLAAALQQPGRTSATAPLRRRSPRARP